jgi:hypothetical protein
VAESVSFDTADVSVVSHVDLHRNEVSAVVSRGPHWKALGQKAEEMLAGTAIAKVLSEETGVLWSAQPVPDEEDSPDVRLLAAATAAVEPHQVEVRHLDDALVGKMYSGQPFDRRTTVQVLVEIFTDAVNDKQQHYQPDWIPKLTLALYVPTPVGAAYVECGREAAAGANFTFREIWLVAERTAHRLRP